MKNRVTIKTTLRSGNPIPKTASDKQIKYAIDIVSRINTILDEIEDLGYEKYANEAGAYFDQMTDQVYSGPFDIIEYMSGITKSVIYQKCYQFARRDKNSAAVKALDPFNHQ